MKINDSITELSDHIISLIVEDSLDAMGMSDKAEEILAAELRKWLHTKGIKYD